MGRKKKDTKIINVDELAIANNVVIDYDELARSIVKAKQIEKEIEKQEKAEALARWQAEIGYNDHADKTGLVKKIFCFFNGFKVVWNIMFISRKKHIATSPTSAFIQGLTSAFFVLSQYILTALAGCFILRLFYHPNVVCGFGDYFMCIVFALISFMLSRIFRLMAIEIEQMSNREQVLGVFTAVMSVIPLIEKIAALFQGVG